MLSAIVFLGDRQIARRSRTRGTEGVFDVAHAFVVTLTDLVPIHIEGLLRDITIVGPAGHELDIIADHAGCEFIAAAGESEGLSAASAKAREPNLFLLEAGIGIEPGFAAECRRLLPEHEARPLYLERKKQNFLDYLLPARRPLAGLILPGGKGRVRPGETFATLARRYHGGTILRCHAFDADSI